MLKLPPPKKVTLDSGATLIYQRNPFSQAVAFGIWIKKGSRDERPAERGFSHLLEHMVFRGTPSRTALDIALGLESIGGQWDAFTGKDSTCYHAKVLEEHFPVLAEILSDIVYSPSIPSDALVTEIKVVQEEIRSVDDSPEEAAYELFFANLFHGDQLGYPVTGKINDLRGCTRRKLLAFHRRTYRPENLILGFVGNIPLQRVLSALGRTGAAPSESGSASAGTVSFSKKRSASLRRSEWGQSHVVAGARLPAADHPDRFALLVLSNILGGGVSSRMFQNMREKAGLVYSVFSHANFWRDTGAFSTFFSVDPKNLRRALDIFHEQMHMIRSHPVDREELESAVAQLKGSVIFGIESVDNRLFRLFQGEFYYGRYVNLESVIRMIDKVSVDDVMRAACEYLGEKDHVYVTCGPLPIRGLLGAGRRSERTVRRRR